MRHALVLGLLIVGSAISRAGEPIGSQANESYKRALRLAATNPHESSQILHSAYQTGRNIAYRDALYPQLRETCRQLIKQHANQFSVSAALALLNELEREDPPPRDVGWLKPLLSSRFSYVRLLAADILWREGEKGLAAPVLLGLFTDKKVQDTISRDASSLFAVMHPQVVANGSAEQLKEIALREVLSPLNDRIPEVVQEEQRRVLEPMLADYRASGDRLHELATLYALEKVSLFTSSTSFQDIGQSIKTLNSQHLELQDNTRVEKAFGDVEEEMLRRWRRSSPFAKTVPASLLKGIAPWEFSPADVARAGSSMPGNAIQRKLMLTMFGSEQKKKWEIRNSPGTVAPEILGPLKALQEEGPKNASEREIRKAVDALRTVAEGAKNSGSPIPVETANMAAEILIDTYKAQPRAAAYPYIYIVEFVAEQSTSAKTRDFLIELIQKHPSEEAVRALSRIGWGRLRDDKILYDAVLKIHQRDGLKGERTSFTPLWTLCGMDCARTQPVTIEVLKAIPNLALPKTYLASIIQTCFPEGYYETLIPRLITVWAAKNPRVETQHVQVYDNEISDAVQSLRYPGYTRSKSERRLPELTMEKLVPILRPSLKSDDPKIRHASYQFLYQMARMELPLDHASVLEVKKALAKEKDAAVLDAGKRSVAALEAALPK